MEWNHISTPISPSILKCPDVSLEPFVIYLIYYHNPVLELKEGR